MKKTYLVVFVLLFVFQPVLPNICCGNYVFAHDKQYVFCFNDKTWSINQADLISNASTEKERLLNNNTLKASLLKLQKMGFDKREAILYIFNNIEAVLEQIAGEVDVSATDSKIYFENNSLLVSKEKSGICVDRCKFFELFFDSIINENVSSLQVPCVELLPHITHNQNALYVNKKGFFCTPIYGTNQEGRIHNISTALSRLNNMRIEKGEKISFNKIIGSTTEQNGYQKAKVIINGKYEDDFGGGVCQAATTLYNALLLSNIKVLEANPHSLKVGYVSGSFDAMVATGISDLVFVNDTNGPIFLSTYCTDLECGVSVFGEKNEYVIKRISENVEFDKEEFPSINSKSIGYLQYFKDGKMIDQKKIRSDKYFVPKIAS